MAARVPMLRRALSPVPRPKKARPPAICCTLAIPPAATAGWRVIGFVTIATALVAFVNTRELSRFGGLFVEHCMIALAVLGLVTVVKGFVTPERSAFFESSAERNRVMAGTGILAGYLFALPYLGFLVASICFYFVMQRSLRAEAAGARSLALAAVTSVAVSGALYALFHYVLLVPLPTGVWGY